MDHDLRLAVQLIVGLICAVVAIPLAIHKGRSAVGWFFLSFFFGLIPIIILACLSNKKSDKANAERAENEARRLREQLRQERLKNEAFRQYSITRLDNHDHVLGVDTRAPAEQAQQQFLLQQPAAPVLPVDERQWFYEMAGVQKGPVPESELRALLQAGKLSLTSLLWSSGMAEWTPAGQVPAFQTQESA